MHMSTATLSGAASESVVMDGSTFDPSSLNLDDLAGVKGMGERINDLEDQNDILKVGVVAVLQPYYTRLGVLAVSLSALPRGCIRPSVSVKASSPKVSSP